MGSRLRLAVLAGLFMLVTACSGGGGDGGDGVASISDENTPSSTAPQDGESDIDKMRAYAKCMKKYGIDVEVDEGDGSGQGGMGVSVDGADKGKVEEADAECKKLMPNGGEPPPMSAEDLDKAREMAQCLRDHGVDVKDPTAEEPGIAIQGDEGNKETVDKAMEECAPEDAKTQGKTNSNGGGK